MVDSIGCKCYHYPKNLLNLEKDEKWICNVFKNVLPSSESENPTPKICAMCYGIGYRYGLTSKYNEESEILAQAPDNQNLVDVESFSMGGKKAEDLYIDMCRGYHHFGKFNYIPEVYYDFKGTEMIGPWGFEISQESFGEVFHLAVARILYPTKITIIVKSVGNKYDGPRIIRQGHKSKKVEYAPAGSHAYDLLRFYGLFRNPEKVSNNFQALKVVTEIIADTFHQNKTQQDKLFTIIRSTFERSHVSPDDIESRCSLSSLGSYYLNCFLRLTSQKELPCFGKNESVALIFVRNSANDPRNMDPSNLERCLSAIMQANATTLEPGKAMRKFKHVILFGDFLEVNTPRQVCTTICEDNITSFTIISQPWAGTGELNYTDESRRFWAEYREDGKVFKPGWEGVPFQVKNLSLFLALQSQYGDNICCIGFRSGFLDAAALLGTPIFYIDEHLPLTGKDDEQWLWKTSDVSDRMVNASNKINTFIRLDIPVAQKSALRDNDQCRLGAALYVYMLHGEEEPPLWTKKVAMFANEKARELVIAAMKHANQK